MIRVAIACCLVVGCYTPQLLNGGLHCAPTGECPAGLSCGSDNRCWEPGTEPIIMADAGAATETIPVEAGKPARLLGETCSPSNAGTPTRTDDCAAGLVCVDGNQGSVCFQRCTTNKQCGAAGCEKRQVENNVFAYVCGTDPVQCIPTAPPSGCQSGRVCYLRGVDTTCETQSGDARNTACTYSRDCLPGFTCPSSGNGAGYCRQTCSASIACSGDLTTCQIADTATFGYCF
jgi:hypothetical protein